MLRTIEDVLGIDPLSLNDAYQRPMSAIFDLKEKAWIVPCLPSPLARDTNCRSPQTKPCGTPHFACRTTHTTGRRRRSGYDWSQEDRIPRSAYNRVLWAGIDGDKPYPAKRSGKDLRRDNCRHPWRALVASDHKRSPREDRIISAITPPFTPSRFNASSRPACLAK